MKKFLILFVFVLYFSFSFAQMSSKGIVRVDALIFNSATGKYENPMYFDRMRKIWYKDSKIIEELVSVTTNDSIVTDSSGKNIHYETWKSIVDKYFYVDLDTRICAEYKVFSKDSFFEKNYLIDTSRFSTSYLWRFFDYQHIWRADTTFSFTDTVMHGVKFNRVKGYIKNSSGVYDATLIGYLRCDKKGSIFHFDKAFDESHECPLMALEIIEERIRQFYEFVFLKDCLTRKEEAIFNAWEKNAKEHPVVPK